MPTIFIKDDLRASVEAATGGLCTVHYTAQGAPCYMRAIQKFNLEDLDPALGTGVHPAFVVDGVTKDVLWIGMYQGIIKNGELLSLPGVDPTTGRPYTAFHTSARAAGAGFHLMTNAEWSAIALWCAKNGFQPRGNTNYGGAHDAAWETAGRIDGALPGVTTGTARHRTGSGPISWRHDKTPAGIADLVGNVWEFTPGLRLVNGEIHILADNNAATAAAFDDTAAWRAILADGSLVAPGTAGTLKYDATGATGSGGVQIDDVIDSRSDGTTSAYIDLMSLAPDTGITVPAILKRLGLSPSLTLQGRVYMCNIDQRYPLRGSSSSNGSGSGLGALHLDLSASYAAASVGGRLAKV